MATTTAAPAQDAVKKAPLTLTPQAVAKVREIMATQDPLPAGLRIGVEGGGCSGFQYSMAFENQAGMMDKVFSFEDLKVYVDATSLARPSASNAAVGPVSPSVLLQHKARPSRRDGPFCVDLFVLSGVECPIAASGMPSWMRCC